MPIVHELALVGCKARALWQTIVLLESIHNTFGVASWRRRRGLPERADYLNR